MPYNYPRLDNRILGKSSEVDASNAWINQFLIDNNLQDTDYNRRIARNEFRSSTASADIARRFNRLGNTGGVGGGTGGGGGYSSGLMDNVKGVPGKIASYLGTNLGQAYDAMMGQQAEVERNIPAPGAAFGAGILAKEALSNFGLDKIGLGLLSLTDPSQTIDQLRQESELRSEINSKTTLTGELSEALRDDIERSAIFAQEFGFTMRDMGDIFIGLVEKSGRFALINEETFRMAAPAMRAFDMTTQDLTESITTFEKVGVGANKTIKLLNEAGLRSVSLGLSGKKVISDINLNISKLNEYGFQNGVKGLERMAQRANEFRMSMDGAFKIADDVMDPDKALSLSANLQVLGGAIGDFNDPLKLMYMATNNVEGLQDALIGAASSLTTYNREQGKFEITGVNLRRAKEMAQQLGVSYTDLSNAAIASAERTQAATQLSANNIKANEKQIEFLTNLARMEDGELKISVPQSIAEKLGGEIAKTQKVAFSEIDQQTANVLLENQKAFEKLSPQQIAEDQLTLLQQMARDYSVVAAYYKYQIAEKLVNPAMKDAANFLKTNLGLDLDKIQKDLTINLGKSIVPTTIPKEDTSTSTTAGTTSTETKNINVNFKSDTDSDRARRAWEEEYNKNPRDFTKFYN